MSITCRKKWTGITVISSPRLVLYSVLSFPQQGASSEGPAFTRSPLFSLFRFGSLFPRRFRRRSLSILSRLKGLFLLLEGDVDPPAELFGYAVDVEEAGVVYLEDLLHGVPAHLEGGGDLLDALAVGGHRDPDEREPLGEVDFLHLLGGEVLDDEGGVLYLRLPRALPGVGDDEVVAVVGGNLLRVHHVCVVVDEPSGDGVAGHSESLGHIARGELHLVHELLKELQVPELPSSVLELSAAFVKSPLNHLNIQSIRPNYLVYV